MVAPAFAAFIPAIIAAATTAAQGVAAGVEHQRPENLLTDEQWLNQRTDPGAAGVKALQELGAGRRAKEREVGDKARYLGVQSEAGVTDPKRMHQMMMRQRMLRGQERGAAAQELQGLRGKSRAGAGMFGQLVSAAGQVAQGAAKSGLPEGMQDIPFGKIQSALDTGVGAMTQASLANKSRRGGGVMGGDDPLFGGGGRGLGNLYGYESLY